MSLYKSDRTSKAKNNGNHRKVLMLAALIVALIPFIYGATISGWHQLVYGGDFSLNATSLNFYTFNTSRIMILNNGNIGIGNTAPVEKLSVAGNLSVTKSNNTMGNISFIQHNSSCAGFRFGSSGGMVLSCS